MKTINVYQFSELSEEAKETAIQNFRKKIQEDNFYFQCYFDEIFDSLKGLFEKCDGVKLKNWSLGECNSWLNIEFDHVDVEDFHGHRAMAWIENNLLKHLRIKFSSYRENGERRKTLKYNEKRNSFYRAEMIRPCPFTGYCYDDDFLSDLIEEIKKGNRLRASFEGLASVYQKLVNDTIEFVNSDEYIKEHFEANEIEFFEDGKQV